MNASPRAFRIARFTASDFSRGFSKTLLRSWCLALVGAGLLGGAAHAASSTWTLNANGNWGTGSNWNNGSPGSTTATNSTDVATFNSAGKVITIDSTTQNIGSINFDGAASAFTVGSTAGNSLFLTSSGTIQILSTVTGSNVTQTVSAPLVLEGTSGTYTFSNNSANGTGVGSGKLAISGGVTAGASSGVTTLVLNGSNTNGNSVNGIIGDGTAQVAVVKSGAGTWNLGAANTFTGGLTIASGTLTSGTVTFAGTGTISLGDTTPGNSNNATLSFAGNNQTITNSLIIQAGSSGTLTLLNTGGGSNTYSGTVSLNNNLVLSTNNKALTLSGNIIEGGSSTLSLTIAAGTSQNQTSVGSSTGTVSLNSGGLNITNNASNALNFTSLITGTGSITYTTNGTNIIVVGSNLNSYSGGTTLNGGIVRGASNLTPFGTGDVTFNSNGTFDMDNTSPEIGLLSSTSSSALVENTGSAGKTLTIGTSATLASDSQSYAGTLGAGFNLALTEGKQTLTGSSGSFTGSVSVAFGSTLNVNGSLGGTGAITISSGGTLGGSGSLGGKTGISAGGNINLVDGSTGTLTVGGLTLSGTSSSSDTLTFEIGTSLGNVDAISTGSLTLSNTNGTKIVIDNLNNVTAQALANGTYNLINYSSTLTGTLADLNLQTLTLDGHTLTLSSLASGELVLTVSGGSLGTYYYTGSTSTDFTDFHNYNTDASSGTAQTAALNSVSDVYIGTSSPTPSNITPTLGTNTITVNSLNFTSSGSGGSLGGSGTLTLVGASDGTVTNGLTDGATGGTTETVNPVVALGGSQNWTVSNSTNTLTVANGVTGSSGQTLTLNGPGTFNFTSGSSTGSYNTTVTGNTRLLLGNGGTGSALGTGTLTVARGATFGGAGQALNMAAFLIGSGGTGTTQVQVGAGGNSTTTNLTLTATGASSIANANLSFNLSSTTLGQSNELLLGSTAITLGSTTLSLNVTGGNIITAGTTYVLMTDSAGFAGLNLAQGTDGVITSGLTILPNAYFGAQNGSGQTSGFYSNSVLLVTDGGTEIEIEVVPEPGTWAMMLGGLAMLVVWQRRKSKVGAAI